MAGTKAGGVKCAQTNKLRYGEDYYVVLGRKGGYESGKHIGRGGFKDRDLARRAGKLGGKAKRKA